MDKISSEIAPILIVDDDPDLCDLLIELFGQHGFAVRAAAWGDEALKIADSEPFSLIIIDIHLPDINGYDLCRQLRAHRRTHETPIIFLTERSERGDKLQGLELGVVDYITKPFDTEELLLRARNAIYRAAYIPPVNPVTELPDMPALDERLRDLLNGDSHWALLMVAVSGLEKLREFAGFVAADEVMRALALILRQAAKEDEFIGHLTPESLVLISTPDRLASIRSKVEMRLNMSIDHFYHPSRFAEGEPDYLRFSASTLTYAAGKYADPDLLKQALVANAETLAQ
jgi:PleD family two-component response regulator